MEEKNQPRRPRRSPEEPLQKNESLVYGKNSLIYCMGLNVIYCFGNTAKRKDCCMTAEKEWI